MRREYRVDTCAYRFASMGFRVKRTACNPLPARLYGANSAAQRLRIGIP
jgi:hypothetical protein